MTVPVRRSIDELVLRYTLQPRIIDVFVEGTLDRDVMKTADERGDAVVCTIDVVDVPPPLLHAVGLSNGHRQRLLALASALESRRIEQRCRCVVDRDVDHWFKDVRDGPIVRWSTFCDTECHFASEDLLVRVATTAGGVPPVRARPLVQGILDVCRRLYTVRLAFKECDVRFDSLPVDRYVRFDAGRPSLSVNSYVDALLMKVGSTARRDEILRAMRDWCEKTEGDVRHACRGHDLTVLIAKGILKSGGKRVVATQEAIERLLVLLSSDVATVRAEWDRVMAGG